MALMRTTANHKFVWGLAAMLILVVWCRPASAISIKEEEELATEFMKVVAKNFTLIDDPLIVDYVRQVGQKISRNIPNQPFTYRFYVIKEEVYNAFAIPAGRIFINSGLLAAMDNEEELAGILAHEMAHVACRHISQQIDRSAKVNLATMAGVVAGIFLGAATGDPTAMQAMTVGSAAAGQSATLAYSREDESQADQIGLGYLYKSGYSGRGMLTVLKKIRAKQWFGADQVPTYMMTHPALEERIVQIDTDMALKNGSKPEPPAESTPLFQEVVTRLKALYDAPEVALQYFQNAMAEHPDNPDTAYGYALVLARTGKRAEAADFLNKALTQNAFDPVILSDLGRVYFLDGKYEKALSILTGVISLGNNNPEALFYLGRTQMELGQLEQAINSFEKLGEIYPDYRPTYQFLGECYGRMSIMPEAHYYLGLYHYKSGDYRNARYHLLKAKPGITDATKREAIEKILSVIDRAPKE
jgi:predicted Zn-dependent protease